MVALEVGSEGAEKARRALGAQAQKTYGRGRPVSTKQIKDKKLRANVKRLEEKYAVRDIRALTAPFVPFLELPGMA